ncbi:hypothetical protein EK21DRAFT_110210 [Setomelanomma holmii]|uniref:XPA C-terminal domain-containing protein n=1 Tax=Setomelanomma holmii TaxID=210430 RepID=A0A9P4LQ15_9PLEO|nr:hypothetical protein EK21DRAFT_110210 [Setomelanomma holmii]
MSARRSGRSKAPVKYTSESEGSAFEDKPRRKSTKSTPKKRTKTEEDHPAPTPKKRSKKDPEQLAAEHRDKAAAQDAKASKAQHKKDWEDWVATHALKDGEGALLDAEPSREESITQTDAGKKYGLKKEELSSLRRFEKKNPVHGNTMHLFREEDVRVLGFRKAGVLAGAAESEVLKQGEEIWREEHKNDPKEDEKPEPKAAKPTKEKTPKQKWTAHVESHALSTPAALTSEPSEAINQSDCKTKYNLLPADLAVLPYFGKPNPKYGNTTKLFDEGEVKTLAYRKAAIVGGVEEGDEVKLLERGKEVFEEGREEE